MKKLIYMQKALCIKMPIKTAVLLQKEPTLKTTTHSITLKYIMTDGLPEGMIVDNDN
jgi:hypothetical protein